MTGYVRTDTTNQIANGNTIDAIPLDSEYDAIQAAFANVSGHTHSGATGEGGPITVIGPAQQVVASSNSLSPNADNTMDLGTTSFEWKDLWIDGVANIDSLVADTADINAGTIDNTTIGATTATTIRGTTITATTGFVGNLTGNASTATTAATATTATTLATPRTINGTSFDGSANIVTTNWGTSRNITIGGTARAVDGSAPVTWSLADIGVGTLGTQASGAVTITGGSITGITDLAVADGGTGVSTITGIIRGNGTSPFTAAVAGTDFLAPAAIGTTVQAFDAGLQSIAGLTTVADRMIYTTASDTYTVTPLTSFARTILDDADAAAVRTTIGAQASDGALTSLAGLSLVAGDVLVSTGPDAVSRLGIGSTGQVLTVSGGAPAWATPPGSLAAANFNAIPASGTYSRTGTLVTVTLTGHGMTTGMQANLDFTTGTATDGSYAVTVVDANTFTITDTASGATSGNVTRNLFIRKSANVASITDNGAGDFTINFTTALPDANYYVTGTARRGNTNNDIALKLANGTDPTTTAVRVATSAGAGQIDGDFIHVVIFN